MPINAHWINTLRHSILLHWVSRGSRGEISDVRIFVRNWNKTSAVASRAAWSAAWSIGLNAEELLAVPSRFATICDRSCSLRDGSFCWAKVETIRPMANPMASSTWKFHDLLWELSSVFYHSGENSRTQSSPTAVCVHAIEGARAKGTPSDWPPLPVTLATLVLAHRTNEHDDHRHAIAGRNRNRFPRCQRSSGVHGYTRGRSGPGVAKDSRLAILTIGFLWLVVCLTSRRVSPFCAAQNSGPLDRENHSLVTLRFSGGALRRINGLRAAMKVFVFWDCSWESALRTRIFWRTTTN